MTLAMYTQLDLLAYRAPVVVAPPEPPVFRPKPHTADELWKMWKLQMSRLLIFNHRVTGQQVSMDARPVKQFLSVGRCTDATYLVTWLSTPHHYRTSSESSEAEHTIAAGAGSPPCASARRSPPTSAAASWTATMAIPTRRTTMPDDVLTTELIALLAAPFPLASIEIKPGATNQAKDKCLCLAYADSRAYMERLDAVVGPSNWSARYEMLSPTIIQCAVTICGVTKYDVGDLPQGDPNAATVASAQAFKRACSNFGLGRYLYSLPQKWADYDGQKRKVVNPQRVAQELYRLAGYSIERACAAAAAAAG